MITQAFDMPCRLMDDDIVLYDNGDEPVKRKKKKKKKKKGGFLKKLSKKFKKIAKFAAPFASFLPIPGVSAVAGLAGAGGKKKKRKKRRKAVVEESYEQPVARPSYPSRAQESYEGSSGSGEDVQAQDEFPQVAPAEEYTGSGGMGEAEAPQWRGEGENFDDGGLSEELDAEEDEEFDGDEDGEDVEFDFTEEDATAWDYFQNPVP